MHVSEHTRKANLSAPESDLPMLQRDFAVARPTINQRDRERPPWTEIDADLFYGAEQFKRLRLPVKTLAL